ncbi:probable methyltransferase-like protein 24 [Penaeus chinensis]|uniref:probable methyltransferase-like protein 24 n=1 Tax=Penaeus chinensis TaxID=139456 RepID=UPI001FB7ED9E|nr:probable methyltransferase-like protein 24 [Penaeus chinensis]
MAPASFLRRLRFTILSILCFVLVLYVKPRPLLGTPPPALTRVTRERYDVARAPLVGEPVNVVPEFVHNTSLAGHELKEQLVLLDQLLLLMTNITKPCRKLVRQGGKLCRGKLDGDKKLCLDPFVRPTSNSCLVYSFGIGYDFSFDAAMGKYGCQVFSFDDDNAHELLDRNPYPRVTFLRLRLAAGRSVKVERTYDPETKSEYIYLYRPLDNIMYLLGHPKANVDVLKIDVDGPEWEIFEDSIFKTDVLERTKQLSMEIHLGVFLDPQLDTGLPLSLTLQKYTRVLRGLEDRGFHLTYNEPNIFHPKYVKFANRTFHTCYEMLFVNTHLKKMNINDHKELQDKFYSEIEIS